jgi:hypothetical protein
VHLSRHINNPFHTSDPEVDEQDAARAVDDHIRWLHITMNDSAVVGECQR